MVNGLQVITSTDEGMSIQQNGADFPMRRISSHVHPN
jgi:hypothetical protein